MTSHPIIELIRYSKSVINAITVDKIQDLLTNGPHYYYKWWNKLFYETPEHVLIETALIAFILWLVFIRRTIDPKKPLQQNTLTQKEIDWLIDTWQPEPLVPALTTKQVKMLKLTPTIESVNGLRVKIKGTENPVINLATFDFLGLGSELSVKEVAQKALEKYGCGSCGPRGFYGSIDQHIMFETAIAKYMGTDEAILYSDGSSAISSSIAAYSKKGDLLIVDEACSEPILTGANLSRSKVIYYKHNDMKDLESVLESIAAEDKRLRIDTKQQRRFIVSEGINKNTGQICNLPELLRLKKKFFYRLVIDETLSFGTLGTTGRGSTEFYGINVLDIDILIISLETSLASVGGVCVGTRDIIDHQRLSGAGYCFSASAPPFLSAAAIHTLHLMETNPKFLIELYNNSKLFHSSLRVLESKGLYVMSHVLSRNATLHQRVPVISPSILTSGVTFSQENEIYPSPIIHLVFNSNLKLAVSEQEERLIHFASKCLELGVGLSVSRFAMLHNPSCLPSARICVSALLTANDINDIVNILSLALEDTNNCFSNLDTK